MTNEPIALAPITIAIAGEGKSADSAARSLRSIEGVSVERIAASDESLLNALSRPDIDALAYAPQMPDLPGTLRRTLLAGRHALVTGPVALASKQLVALDELARRRERVIMLDDGNVADERLDFVRKMTAGPTALWQPRYIRTLHTGPHGDSTLDELAICEIAAAVAIAGARATRVSAISPRIIDDESSDAAMITIALDSGAAIRIDISLAEPALRHEITVACEGRTIVLDAFDLRAPLQIHAGASYRGPQSQGQWAETISEHPLSGLGDQAARAAQAFTTAVRARDVTASNAHEIATASLVWETARDSIARSGEMIDLTGTESVSARRPELQLIRGGGHHVDDAPAPALRVVGRSTSIAAYDDGPRSA